MSLHLFLLSVSALSETTVYSDRLSIHYPPISDAFDNIEYFFCIKQMIQLWHYWEIACSITINKIIFHCYKKHLKWGDEVMKKVSPIIQCSMALSCFANYLFVTNRVQRFFQSSMTHLGEHTSKSIDHFAVC